MRGYQADLWGAAAVWSERGEGGRGGGVVAEKK